MFMTLCTFMVLASAPTQQPPAREAPLRADPALRSSADSASLDGSWTVVCFEKDGMPVKEMKDKTLTVKDNVITCSDDKSDMKSMKVQFGPNHTIQVWDLNKTGTATDTTDKSANEVKSGTYILTNDYAAICLHDGLKSETKTTETNGNSNERTSNFRPETKTKCTIILKKTDGK